MRKNNRKIKPLILKSIRLIFINERGSGLGTIFIGVSCLLLVLLVLINIADYSVYTFKRNNISKAMDYAVTAAVQQLSHVDNEDSLADGFSEMTGAKSTENIKIDMDSSQTAFISVLKENVNLVGLNLDDNLLICSTYTNGDNLNYCIKTNRGILYQGMVDSPTLIEDKINEAIELYWPDSEDNSKVHINQNPKTNMLQKGTYLFAFIKEIKVSGIHTQRSISLSSLAGAKVER